MSANTRIVSTTSSSLLPASTACSYCVVASITPAGQSKLEGLAGWFSWFIFEEPLKLEVTSSLSFSRHWSILSGGVFVTDIRDTEEHFQLYWTHWQYLHDLCYLNRKIPWYLLSSEGKTIIVRASLLHWLILQFPPHTRKSWYYILPVVLISIIINIPRFLEGVINWDDEKGPSYEVTNLRMSPNYIKYYRLV